MALQANEVVAWHPRAGLVGYSAPVLPYRAVPGTLVDTGGAGESCTSAPHERWALALLTEGLAAALLATASALLASATPTPTVAATTATFFFIVGVAVVRVDVGAVGGAIVDPGAMCGWRVVTVSAGAAVRW